MGRPRGVGETAGVEPGGAGGRMHRGLRCGHGHGRGGGVVPLHRTARRPWEEPAPSGSPKPGPGAGGAGEQKLRVRGGGTGVGTSLVFPLQVRF